MYTECCLPKVEAKGYNIIIVEKNVLINLLKKNLEIVQKLEPPISQGES